MSNPREQMIYAPGSESEPETDLGIPVSCDANAAENDQKDSNPQYTIQGVLHFLQTEWARLETQRSDWETDRAELKARIAFLEGERRGQENLKQDLVRRIKMLEYALKQERVKFHQYKASVSANSGAQPGTKRVNEDNGAQSWCDESSKPLSKQLDAGEKLALYTKQALESSSKWLESRSRLKKFLEEVGCTDTVLSLRQARVLQLLKSTPEWRSALTDAENKLPNVKMAADRNNISDDQLQSALSEMDEAIGGIHAVSAIYGDEPIEPDTTGQTFELSDGIRVNRFRRTGGTNSSSTYEKQQPVTSCLGGDSVSPPSSMANAVSTFISALKSNNESLEPKHSSGPFMDKNILGLIDSLSDNPGDISSVLSSQFNEMGVTLTQNRHVLDRTGATSTRLGEPDHSVCINESADLTKDHVPPDGLVLGDLASLTVANETESITDTDIGDSSSQLRTTYDANVGHSATDADSAKSGPTRQPLTLSYNLRGHFDAIRSVAFHPTDRALFTASEDGCVMLWYLGKLTSSASAVGGQSKQSNRGALQYSTEDLEPVHVYRGHEGPVLCLTTPNHSVCSNQSCAAFSGGLDGTIRGWYLPPATNDSGIIDLYAPYELSASVGPVFRGSKAAVWAVSSHPSNSVLIAAHADGAIEFWSSSEQVASGNDYDLLHTVHLDQLIGSAESNLEPIGRPTCLQYLVNRPDSLTASQCVIGTDTGWLLMLDVCTGHLVSHYAPSARTSRWCANAPFSELAFNGLVVQPTLSLVVGAHEDKRIRFYDIGRISVDHSKVANIPVMGDMYAHTDSVTCVAIDPQGLYVLTGSHDASIRLWDLQSRSCVQEMTNHRLKNNEAVLSVALHPRLPLAASAGADGICKVYGTADWTTLLLPPVTL